MAKKKAKARTPKKKAAKPVCADDLSTFAVSLWALEDEVRAAEFRAGWSYQDEMELLRDSRLMNKYYTSEESFNRLTGKIIGEADNEIKLAKKRLCELAPLIDRERLIEVLATLTELSWQIGSGEWDEEVIKSCRSMLIRHKAELLAIAEIEGARLPKTPPKPRYRPPPCPQCGRSARAAGTHSEVRYFVCRTCAHRWVVRREDSV